MTAPVAVYGAALRRAARGQGARLSLIDRLGATMRWLDASTWYADAGGVLDGGRAMVRAPTWLTAVAPISFIALRRRRSP